MFHKITIIGFGLIGSSLAQALKAAHIVETITAADASQEVCDTISQHQLADFATTDLAAAVEDADIVVLAVPVGAMKDIAAIVAPHMKDGAILTDTGSVKSSVVDMVLPKLPDHIHFVPAHPIAGTEHSGPLAGFPELFRNRWAILTPLPETALSAIEKVTQMWEATGAMIEIMSIEHHDLILGITSHLPHLIAYTIVGTATDLEDDIKSEVVKFSASGFRDFTRIAASDPTMWRDVFLNNRSAVLEILQRFNEDLTALQRAIRQADGDYLYRTFERTRGLRRAIIDAGQAEYPKQAPHPDTAQEGEAR
jgi:cyclohexadieny/prephenate dehydrogenase